MDPSESCNVPRAVLANTTTHHITEKATIESMPTEIHWQILRNFLKCSDTIELFPQDTYINRSWGFGSLGILSVSKHFSTIGLSVLYRENEFSISKSDCSLKDFDYSMNPVNEREPHSHEYFKSVRWINLRNLPKDQLPTVSGIDCLDVISQTQPGQERLKNLRIDLSPYVLMLFMGGSLLRILRRLHGIQSLELQLIEGWREFVPRKDHNNNPRPKESSANADWSEHFGRDFLLLIKSELGHVKVIMLRSDPKTFEAHIPKWISHELEKRNKAWVPPPPSYMNFHRTTSSVSVVHSEIIKLLAVAESRYKPERHTKSVSYLENNYGVFS